MCVYKSHKRMCLCEEARGVTVIALGNGLEEPKLHIHFFLIFILECLYLVVRM